MAYAFLTLTIVLSILALPFWNRVIRRRVKHPTDLADAGISDWPALISIVLPRPARRVWHGFLLALALLMVGGLHYFVLAEFWAGGIKPGLYIIYFASLGLWLAALALPIMVIHSHRQARASD